MTRVSHNAPARWVKAGVKKEVKGVIRERRDA
jgi:hypothetical protein